MATVTVKDENRTLTDPAEIRSFLGTFGIWYRSFEGVDQLGHNPTDEEILEAFAEPIALLKSEGGYQTADVINITPKLVGLEALLNKFNREHWHDEDEVRFIVHGSGLFHLNPKNGPVFSIEVVKGDMINVPRGTLHWFHLCQERTIRAIRLFQSKAGWTPEYTASGVDESYQPLCLGPSDLPPNS